MRKPYLVIGANGALGSDLMSVLPDAVPMLRAQLDICNAEQVQAEIERRDIQGVINTAAFHDVPLCEQQREQAFAVNALGAANLAKACAAKGIHLCHVSTDYVFDGSKGQPYLETDLPRPLSVYAASKLAGEHLVAAYCPDHSIVRSCGLYGNVPTRVKGRNFITTMLALGRTKEEVCVVDDEWVTPTYTRDLAQGICDLLEAGGRGVFHLTQEGATTWFDFAHIIFQHFQLPARLERTKAAAFQSAVQRPHYSVLDNRRFAQLTGKPLPSWDDALKRHLRNDYQGGGPSKL